MKRALGIAPSIGCGGRVSWTRMMDWETAGLIAEAIGVAPWEVMPDEDVPAGGVFSAHVK